jgi:hypothetical protein
VNKPMDNHREMRITARFLWIISRMAGKPEMAGRGLLRGARPCSRNILPSETGTTWGATLGTLEEPGDRSSRGYLAPAGGTRRRYGQATDQPVRRGRAGPLHLIHGGALPDYAQPERPGRDRHAAAAATPAAMTLAAAERTGELPGRPRRDRRRQAREPPRPPPRPKAAGIRGPPPCAISPGLRPGASCPACWPCQASPGAPIGWLPGAARADCLPAACAQTCG